MVGVACKQFTCFPILGIFVTRTQSTLIGHSRVTSHKTLVDVKSDFGGIRDHVEFHPQYPKVRCGAQDGTPPWDSARYRTPNQDSYVRSYRDLIDGSSITRVRCSGCLQSYRHPRYLWPVGLRIQPRRRLDLEGMLCFQQPRESGERFVATYLFGKAKRAWFLLWSYHGNH